MSGKGAGVMLPHELVEAGEKRVISDQQLKDVVAAIEVCQAFRVRYKSVIGSQGHEVETMISNVFTVAKKELNMLLQQTEGVK